MERVRRAAGRWRGETKGDGSQMLRPLAIAVIGGIVLSLALSLIVTPAVHYYLPDSGARKQGSEAEREAVPSQV
ncbi:MAG TPA: efflux RND transporter permease subunit [Terriglobales bacterium]|nr:efflux RND transporter permease subunit [Terriglobales bacterium]